MLPLSMNNSHHNESTLFRNTGQTLFQKKKKKKEEKLPIQFHPHQQLSLQSFIKAFKVMIALTCIRII